MYSTFAKVLVQHGDHQFLVTFRLEKGVWTALVSEFKDKTESNRLNIGYSKPPSDQVACELAKQYLKVRKRDK